MNGLIYSSENCKLINTSNIKWPENNGCNESTEEQVLIVPFKFKKTKIKENIIFLNLIDRFGPSTGFYFGDAGVTWKERSLPWFDNNNNCKQNFNKFIKTAEYNQYIILKPFIAYTCTIAPAFGGTGGAIQYRSERSIRELLKEGIIQKVNKNNYNYPNFEFGKLKKTKENNSTSTITSTTINTINNLLKYLSRIK